MDPEPDRDKEDYEEKLNANNTCRYGFGEVFEPP
jgi:hypothetical protein